MVAHNGADYLPATLAALRAQTRPADVHIGVDTGSADSSAALLQLGLPAGSTVVAAPDGAGFGAAVAAGLAGTGPDPAGPDPAAQGPAGAADQPGAGTPAGVQDWIWLLHDDSAPEPDALEELLLAVETAPSVTIAGCKQVDWNNPSKLVDVGLTVSRGAERLTLIDLDEVDQGQYDGRSDFFAVNSAGMLVRRDAFDRLGGFDPALPGVGDDVDLCWRNRLAGHRVVVVPTATVRHAAGRDGSPSSATAARKSQIHLRLKHAPLWKLPLVWAGSLLGGLASLVLSIVAKDPGHGLRQLAATVTALLRPRQVHASRKQAAKTRRTSRRIVRALMVRPLDVLAYRRSLLESLNPEHHAVGDGTGTDARGGQQPTGGSDDFAALAAPERGWLGTGPVAAALVLALLAVIGMSDFLGVPALAGGALLPVSATFAEVWHNASAWWQSIGSGYPGPSDPFGYLLAVLSLLGLGNGSAAVVVLAVLAMPLASFGAWLAAGAVTQRRGLRLWAAFFWAALPPLQVALGQGRLGALIVHLMVPLVLLGLLRATGSAIQRTGPDAAGDPAEKIHKPGINGIPSWTAAAAAGLCLAAVTASAPALLPVIVLFVAVIALTLGRRGWTVWWALVPPVVLALPMLTAAGGNPRVLLADPGVPLAFEAAPPWQQLMGFPVAFDASGGLAAFGLLEPLGNGPWALVFALLTAVPVLLLAAAALFLQGRGAALARIAWLGALITLGAGWLAGHIATAVAPGAVVTPFPGPFVSLALFLLVLAGLVAADRVLPALAAPGRKAPGEAGRVLPVAAGAIVVLLAAGPAVNLAQWFLPQVAGYAAAGQDGSGSTPRPLADFGTRMLIYPSEVRTLPATAADRGNGQEQTRSLVMDSDGSGAVTAAVMHGSGTTLDQLSALYAARTLVGPLFDAAVAEGDGAAAAVRDSVAVIVAGTGVDPRPELTRLGVGFVVVRGTGTAAEVLARQIDAVPGLAPVGPTDAGWLWRVVPEQSGGEGSAGPVNGRVNLFDHEGNVLQGLPSGRLEAGGTIPAGNDGRILALAERADAGWQATLDGERLEATDAGWFQAFKVPAAGGDVRVSYYNPWAVWIGLVQVIAITLTLLLAIPIPSRRRFTPRRLDHIRTTGLDSSADELQLAAHEIDRDEAGRRTGGGPADAPVLASAGKEAQP
ncbi:glycosyltransferase [Arthrobacter mobilis]|uniref:Glycosyltransferase family 2 protein n=1 Tax=Arthrobacter mobilis TaxID=2724944 RepID=A0A7X6K4I8_9MICC|nr:glycosyltransferase family 2 protein [Arthrobacter mobilis]